MPLKFTFAATVLLCLATTSTQARDHRIKIPMVTFEQAPVLDGELGDWAAYRDTIEIALRMQVVESNDFGRESKANNWDPQAILMSGVHGDRIYIALSWNDSRADNVYRPWKLIGNNFTRSRTRDDMAAFRFETAGDFNACMLSGDTYSVDLWRWSAGRSAMAGIADDMSHHYSTTYDDNAASYPYEDQTVYIRKWMDEGEGGWGNTRRPDPKLEAQILKSIEAKGLPRGSRADVRAKARWKDGRWTLELSRLLDTGDPLDVTFAPDNPKVGQIALFNAGYNMRKMASAELDFDIIRAGRP